MLHVYITSPNLSNARKIANILIKEKLAKCVNIHKTLSIYPWNGKIQNETEFVLIVKTSEKKYKELENTVIDVHPYKIPCIVGIKITKGYSKFISWVHDL